MYCPNCNSEVLTEVKTVSETYPVKGEEITVTAKVRCCKNCGQDIWDEELDGQNLLDAFAIYRQRHGLLQPEEIRRIREKYGLSQVAFAKVLGLGNKTVARYENGSIADMAQNNLIELMKQPSNFRELLQKNQDKISKQDYENAMNNLETLRVKVTVSYTTDSNMVYNLRPNSPNNPEFWGIDTMPKASVLQFDNYTVEELLFKKEPVKADQNEFQLQPHFEQEIVNLGDDKYDVHLSFDITPTEDHPMPFHIHVAIVGHFTYFDQDETIDANLKDHILQTNTISILFPFLRQIVATLTNNANVATLMLPIMNFNDGGMKKKTE